MNLCGVPCTHIARLQSSRQWKQTSKENKHAKKRVERKLYSRNIRVCGENTLYVTIMCNDWLTEWMKKKTKSSSRVPAYMAMALTSSQLSSSLCYAACHHSIQIINFNENLPIMSFVHINNIFLPYVRSSLSALMESTPHSALIVRTEAIALFHVPQTKTYIVIISSHCRKTSLVSVQKNVACIKCKIQIDYYFKANNCSTIWMPVKATCSAAKDSIVHRNRAHRILIFRISEKRMAIKWSTFR